MNINDHISDEQCDICGKPLRVFSMRHPTDPMAIIATRDCEDGCHINDPKDRRSLGLKPKT